MYKGFIIVDSNKRNYGNINDYFYHLDKPIEIDAICLKNLSLSNSFYNITTANNVLTTEDGTATLDAGFYNVAEVVSELNTQLQALDASYVVTHNSITGKITIVRTGAFTITFTTLLGNLGFLSTQTLSGAATYTGSQIVDLNTIKDVFIECPQLSVMQHSNGKTRSFMTKIPIKNSLGEVLSADQDIVNVKLKNSQIVSELSIRLTDIDGNLLEPNGVNHSFNIYYY